MDPHPVRAIEGDPTLPLPLRCESCGASARVRRALDGTAEGAPDGTLERTALRCAACGQPVRLSAPQPVSGDDLRALLRDSPVPVLADFHAEWCAPCKWLDPVLDELAAASEGRFLVVKVDTDAAPDAAREHAIGSVPTVILFEGGREVERSLGVEPERLRAWVRLGDRPSSDDAIAEVG